MGGLDSGLHSLPEAVATLLHRNLELFSYNSFYFLLNKNSFAPTVIKHEFINFNSHTEILLKHGTQISILGLSFNVFLSNNNNNNKRVVGEWFYVSVQ